MRRFLTVFALSLTPIWAQDAALSLRHAVEKMGGGAFKTLHLEGAGYTHLLEQSERPEGPWLHNYEQIVEEWDLPAASFRRKVAIQSPGSKDRREMSVRMSGGVAVLEVNGRVMPAPAGMAADFEQQIRLHPARLLTKLSDARHLRYEVFEGVPHEVIEAKLNGVRVWLWLNRETGLPSAVDEVLAHSGDTFWQVWGDVVTRYRYSSWTLVKGAGLLPMQVDVERNGLPYRSWTYFSLTANGPVESFAEVSAEVRQQAAAVRSRRVDNIPLGNPRRPAVELAPGLVKIPGSWDVALIEQASGVWVLEGPISGGFSQKVRAEAERRFPGKRIIGVITTSDAWPHVGGLRDYVAAGVPVYALARNRPILERLMEAPHSMDPDALARNGRTPDWHWINHRSQIGAGSNRFELIPIAGESGERMMAVWFPEHRLLYGSDLAQRSPQGEYFMPAYLLELIDLCRREELAPERLFAMHLDATPWSEIVDAVNQAR